MAHLSKGHRARLAELKAVLAGSANENAATILAEIHRIEAYTALDQASYDALVQQQIKRLRRMTSGHPGTDDAALNDITALGEPDGSDAT